MDAHDGHQILSRAPPALFTHKNFRTTTGALHKIYYNGKVIKWDFTQAALKYSSNRSLDPKKISTESRGLYSLYHEHYLCGDEQSVCGRFAQNVLTPVTAVAFANNITTRFGDFKVSAESKAKKKLIPDFVAVHCTATKVNELSAKDIPEMMFVGEAKTPWNHNLQSAYRDYFSNDPSTISKSWLRHALGQIAQYMHHYQMKYGFLTTYNDTIFIKQGPIEKTSEWALYISPPIHYSAVADESKGYPVVTVRQCMYYLMRATCDGGHIAQNPTELDTWVDDQTPRDRVEYFTPARDTVETPERLLHMISKSPMFPRKSSSNINSMELHRTSNGDTYMAVLQFKSSEIFSEKGKTYAVFNGQKVPVLLKVYKSESSDDESRGQIPAPLQSSASRGRKSDNTAPSKPRVAFNREYRDPEPIDEANYGDDSGSASAPNVETPTRGAAQRQGHGYPVSSSPQRRPVPPVGQHQPQSRGHPGVRETSPSPYAPYPTSQSPPRVLSQTRETTLPHRPPPPPGQYQSSSRDPSQIRVANPPNYPSMGSRQGGSPDRQAGRDDSGSKDKGKGKANTLPTNTKEYNLRSHVDKKGDSSKDKGKDKDNGGKWDVFNRFSK
ncbi:hypothetical protein MGYG_04373 [Nannizzia gypsea CBS 118893]|uniref:Uncharacterized protein n=1 Tax=Arthroderma gypseum (strain ATCC MYA-4604 / CBS 118893) TaxID=535722 RepID=E4USL5_ARTGP|nr:hypothetical protein MGYG_04373 [Nannizzia gypsea CBS 118893]EFR01366.1 hypothetical protein MGYG_04373 [Nannizzia gypsea CBS 118893]